MQSLIYYLAKTTIKHLNQCPLLSWTTMLNKSIHWAILATTKSVLYDLFLDSKRIPCSLLYFMYFLHDKLYRIMRCRIQIVMLTDPACLFYIIIRSSKTAEQRLMFDLLPAKRTYESQDIKTFGELEPWIILQTVFASPCGLTACKNFWILK